MPIFKFLDKAVEKYKIHGVAHAKISDMSPVPLSGCIIDLEPLLEIEEPKYYWVRETRQAPTIIIASEKAKSIPASATAFGINRKLESLIVTYTHTHPKKDYDNLDVKATYNK